MTDAPSPALETALAYHRAWTGHDFDRAMTYVADDIVCEAPAGPIRGARAFRDFMEPFSHILTDSRVIAAFGDETTALMMYDTTTLPVASAPGAECLTVGDGVITHLRIIFNQAPFIAAEQARRTPTGG
ncbi:nuclear transport factor 2 family protein [Streptomyces yaizuensis]|uniref:Nuclear transport factor 2 family protein n=1 Tax=Streptomyces yaizuensis TaxID=2989713 RepID=A0ABQ5NRL0_9ACTN|nr:nuclear transport factor 2 family protein [Streptomyces sp. YSPA8]GLF93014.1 nuclear transport factor 2 family protein [Streptomyces sp. YSPA8]